MGRYDAETTTTLHDGRIFDPEKEHDRKKVPAEEIARLHLVTAKGIRFVEWDKRWKRAFLSRMDPVLQAEIKELCRRGAVGSILEIECQALSVAGEIVLRLEMGSPAGQRDFQNRWILPLLGTESNIRILTLLRLLRLLGCAVGQFSDVPGSQEAHHVCLLQNQ